MRPDISFAIATVTQYMQNPKKPIFGSKWTNFEMCEEYDWL